MLAPQKVTKEEGTQPSRPKGSLALLKLGLSSVALPDLGISGHETRPSSLHTPQAATELRQSLPSSLFCLRYSA